LDPDEHAYDNMYLDKGISDLFRDPAEDIQLSFFKFSKNKTLVLALAEATISAKYSLYSL
jgi:hypothetical protein